MADNETGNITEEEGAGKPVGEDEAENQTEEEGKSNKKALIIKIAIAVLVILLAAGGGYFFFMVDDESEPTEGITSEEQSDIEVVEDGMSSDDEPPEDDGGADSDFSLDEESIVDESADDIKSVDGELLEETDIELEDVLIPEDNEEAAGLEEENHRLKQEVIDLKSQRESKATEVVEPKLDGYYFDEQPLFIDNGDSLRETTEDGGLEPKWGEFKRAK